MQQLYSSNELSKEAEKSLFLEIWKYRQNYLSQMDCHVANELQDNKLKHFP